MCVAVNFVNYVLLSKSHVQLAVKRIESTSVVRYYIILYYG